jgi:hypothetical protein
VFGDKLSRQVDKDFVESAITEVIKAQLGEALADEHRSTTWWADFQRDAPPSEEEELDPPKIYEPVSRQSC